MPSVEELEKELQKEMLELDIKMEYEGEKMKKLVSVVLILVFNIALNAKILPMVQFIPLNPIGIVADNQKFILSDIISNSLYIYETKTKRLAKILHLPFKPTSLDKYKETIYIGTQSALYKLTDTNKQPIKVNIALQNNQVVIKTISLKNHLIVITGKAYNNKFEKLIVFDKKTKHINPISLKQNIGFIVNNKNQFTIYYKNIEENLYNNIKNNILMIKYKNNKINFLLNKSNTGTIAGIIDKKHYGIGYVETKDIKYQLKDNYKYGAFYYDNFIYYIDKKFNIKKVNITTKNITTIFSNTNKTFSNIQNLEFIKYINNNNFTINKHNKIYSTVNNSSLVKQSSSKIDLQIDGKSKKILTINKSYLTIFARLSDKQHFILLSLINKKTKQSLLMLHDIKKNKFIYSKTLDGIDMAISGLYIEKLKSIYYTTSYSINKININTNTITTKEIDGINILLLYKDLILAKDLNTRYKHKNYFYNKNLQLQYKYISFFNDKHINIKSHKGYNISISKNCRIGYTGVVSKNELKNIRKKYCTKITILDNGYFNGSGDYKKYIHFTDTKNLKTYNINAFYNKFYRTDLVKKALQGKTITQKDTLKKVIKNKLAPEVEVVRVSSDISKDELISNTSNQYVYVTLKIKPNSGGVGDIHILNNGIIVKSANGRGLKRKKKKKFIPKKYKVYLKRGKNTISVYVTNKDNSMRSDIISYTVNAKLNKVKNKNLHAVIIGIDKFKNTSNNLTYTVKDAKAFAKLLKKVASNYYDNVDIKLLITPKQTTKVNIKKVLKKYAKKVNTNDTFIFYGATHGFVDEMDGKYYFITSDYDGELKNSIDKNTLVSLLANVKMQNKLIILDTCYSTDGSEDMITDLVNPSLQKIAKSGISIYAGSGTKQEALDGYKGHGLFTYTLLEGMKNIKHIGNKDTKITVSELGSYIENQVPLYADKINFIQTPLFEKSGENFEIGR